MSNPEPPSRWSAHRAPTLPRKPHPGPFGLVWLLPAFLLALFLGACEAPAEQDGPPLVDDLPERSLTEVLRIGDVDDPDAGFTRPTQIEPGPDGRFVVVEGLGPELRIYDPDGVLESRFGRGGEGPGEFRSTPRVGFVGDTLWAFDGGSDRMTIFLTDGTVLTSRRIDEVQILLPNGLGSVRPRAARDDGTVAGHLSRISSVRPGNGPELPSPTTPVALPLVAFDLQGRVVDTVGVVRYPNPRMWSPPGRFDPPTYDFFEDGDVRILVPTPPPALPYYAGTADGFVEADANQPMRGDLHSFHVTRVAVDREGTPDTLWSRELAYRPVPYERQDLDSIAVRAVRTGGGMIMGGSRPPVPENWRELADRLLPRMNFPAYRLPVNGMHHAGDGTFWARLSGPEGRAEERWILVDTEGELQGQVRIPSGARILGAAGDTVWLAVPDEMGVPWVVRYRMEGGEG